MTTPPRFVLTKTVDKSIQPWMDDDECYPAGTVVYFYTGCTYGCIGSSGMAVTINPDVEPFFEVPRDAVAASASQ